MVSCWSLRYGCRAASSDVPSADVHSTLYSCQSLFMRAFVCWVHPPKCIHLFQQLNVSSSNFQLLQSPHAGLKGLGGFIASLGLGRNEQPSVYACLLLLEVVGFLAHSGIVIVGRGPGLYMILSGFVELISRQLMYKIAVT